MNWNQNQNQNQNQGQSGNNRGNEGYQEPTTTEGWLKKIDRVIKFDIAGYAKEGSKYPPAGIGTTNILLKDVNRKLNDLGGMLQQYIKKQEEFNAAVLEYMRGKAHG